MTSLQATCTPAPYFYNHLGPFSSQTKGRSLAGIEFLHVLSFLAPKDLAHAERVCRAWKQFIGSQERWKEQCQVQLGIHAKMDPKGYLPSCSSYKKCLQLMSSSILDGSIYEFYVGKVGPVPQIPKEISLKKWKDPDPCDPTTTIGAEYVWMYCPSHITINIRGFTLDRPDDPNDIEGSRP